MLSDAISPSIARKNQRKPDNENDSNVELMAAPGWRIAGCERSALDAASTARRGRGWKAPTRWELRPARCGVVASCSRCATPRHLSRAHDIVTRYHGAAMTEGSAIEARGTHGSGKRGDASAGSASRAGRACLR